MFSYKLVENQMFSYRLYKGHKTFSYKLVENIMRTYKSVEFSYKL